MGIGTTTRNIIIAIVGIVVALELFTVLLPLVGTSGDTLNSSGVPFGSLFVAGGLVQLLLMVGLLIFVITRAMGSTGK